MRVRLQVQWQFEYVWSDFLFALDLSFVLLINLATQVLKCITDQLILLDELLGKLALASLILLNFVDHPLE